MQGRKKAAEIQEGIFFKYKRKVAVDVIEKINLLIPRKPGRNMTEHGNRARITLLPVHPQKE